MIIAAQHAQGLLVVKSPRKPGLLAGLAGDRTALGLECHHGTAQGTLLRHVHPLHESNACQPVTLQAHKHMRITLHAAILQAKPKSRTTHTLKPWWCHLANNKQ